MKRALLRKAAPVTGEYQVGDIVSYCRNARKGESGLQWSVGSRIVGFEGLTCWVMCDGIPVCVAKDRLRPCTAAELLAYQYTNKNFEAATTEQQSYVDERRPRNAEELSLIHI